MASVMEGVMENKMMGGPPPGSKQPTPAFQALLQEKLGEAMMKNSPLAAATMNAQSVLGTDVSCSFIDDNLSLRRGNVSQLYEL